MKNLVKKIGLTFIGACAIGPQLSYADSYTVTPSNATYARGGQYADINYNNNGLKIKNCENADYDRKAFLKFILPSDLASNIQSARLQLQSQNHSDSIDLHEIISNWGENGLTWNNAPAMGKAVGESPLRSGLYTTIDVTEYIQEKVDNQANSASFMLKDNDSLCRLANIYDELSSFSPKLVIVENEELLANQSYFIDAQNGDDSNDGTSEAQAWKSVNRIHRATLNTGTRILFKADQEHEGHFMLSGSGSVTAPATLGRYGEGSAPHIKGIGLSAAIHLLNAENVKIENLEVTNYNADEEGGKTLAAWEASNITDWFDVPVPRS